MTNKSCFLIVFLILISTFAGAISISASDSVAQGQQWSMDVDLIGLSNGDEARVLIDDSQVFVVGKISDSLFVIDSKTSSKVISNNLNGNNLTIVYSGLNAGTYTLKVETNSESDQTSLSVFEVVTRAEQDILENKVSAFGDEITVLRGTINNLETELSTKDTQIANLTTENSNLKNSMQYLESNITLLEQEGKSKDEILSSVKDDLNLLLTEREESLNSPIAGMFAFGSENSGFLIGILALIALVVVGVFIKSRTTSIYDSPLLRRDEEPVVYETKEDSLLVPEEKKPILSGFFSKFKKAETIESPVLNKKRWATESYSPAETVKPKKEEKRFDLGDLIRKD
ncbi:MAG: hypothetical protein WC915_03535 [archaeon]|jgi:hypothetical protein